MIIEPCFKCGTNAEVVHHVSYIPDKVVPCCHVCHNEIHRRIRKEGKCAFSVEEVEKMSRKSTWKRSNINRKPQIADYAKRFQTKLDFLNKLDAHIYHREHLNYNVKTGNVYVHCDFMTDGTIKLPMEMIE